VADRDRIQQEIERVAFGKVELSGREIAARVSALRRVEQMSRVDDAELPLAGRDRGAADPYSSAADRVGNPDAAAAAL
jgi:hypothetical protein